MSENQLGAELLIDTSELDRALEAFPNIGEDLKGEIIQDATGAAADVLYDAAVTLARTRIDRRSARSTGLPAGVVKADLRVTPLADNAGWLVGPSAKTAYVVRWLEFGHRLVKGGQLSMKRGKLRGRGKQIGEVSAHPFMRPAFDSASRPAAQAAQSRLSKLILDRFRALVGLKKAA